jgi:flagellin-like hook-associated protein FlgL
MTYESNTGLGVLNHYGPRETNGKYGAATAGTGIVKRAQWEFSYNDLPDAATNGLGFVIPAGAIIKSAVLYVDQAWTSTSGTTDLTVGLQEADGTGIDNDGLIDATDATQTAIATEGNVVNGGGALVGATIGSAAGELVVAGTDTDLTAGKARVVVEYVYDKD